MGLREEKEQLTRAEIIDAAFQLFCENGIEATEMMKIAKRAKVSRPTLYRYFESKQQLAEAVYLENLGLMMDHFDRYTAEMSAYETARTFLVSVYEILAGDPQKLVFDAMYNLYASRLQVDPTALPEHPLNQPFNQMLVQAISNNIHDGTVRFLGDGNDLIDCVFFPYFAHIQRLAIFSYQRNLTSWKESLRQAEMIKDFYLRTLTPVAGE
jgi:AcrR family transcriptional regulator